MKSDLFMIPMGIIGEFKEGAGCIAKNGSR